jgi:hypothetical protein
MEDKIRQSWERFLHPESLRTNLIVGSLFIAAFEMLTDSIIDHIRNFFSTGFNQSGFVIDERYKTEVLSLNKSPLYASLEWLKNMNAVNDKDIEEFEKIKQCRNELAHEFVNFLSTGPTIDPLPLFPTMIDLLSKIEKWWILNVEIPTDPDFNGKDIDEDGIIPGPIMTLRLLTDIALGSEEESKYYYEFIKQKGVI